MEVLSTIPDVIARLGGSKAVAEKYGRGVNAVGMWKARNRLPAELFLVMRADLKAKSCTAPAHLWGMVEPKEAA